MFPTSTRKNSLVASPVSPRVALPSTWQTISIFDRSPGPRWTQCADTPWVSVAASRANWSSPSLACVLRGPGRASWSPVSSSQRTHNRVSHSKPVRRTARQIGKSLVSMFGPAAFAALTFKHSYRQATSWVHHLVNHFGLRATPAPAMLALLRSWEFIVA